MAKSKQRRAAYGAPAEEKEVVIALDRRLLYVLGLVAVFGVALLVGMYPRLFGGGASPRAVGAPAAAPVADAPDEEAQARATAQALGLPDDITIVDTQVETFESTVEPPSIDEQVPQHVEGVGPVMPGQDAPAAGGSGVTAAGGAGDAVDPNDPRSLPGAAVEIVPQGDRKVDASTWPHDVLAKFEDPNVTDPDYAPLRLEEAQGTYDGPRLAISELNDINTFDFGPVSMKQPTSRPFEIANVGSEDLVISRVYTGCGCTATQLGGVLIDPAGFLPTPHVIQPGERVAFTVEFDPRAEGKTGAQAKFIQIFSNDTSTVAFDPADPNSHESRFRIVVEPTYGVE